MIRRIGREATLWLARWGFATLVAMGIAIGIWGGAAVDPPDALPSYALQAQSIYRLEVAAAIFAAAYVTALAFVLALGNRGFTELSASGVKARNLRSDTLDETVEGHEELLRELAWAIAELQRDLARRGSAE